MTQPENHSPQAAPQTPARRRVLQGLAVPLVMTVVPGSALAAGSTGLCLARCDEEARSGYKKAASFTNSPDGWYRLERQLYKLEIRYPGKSKFTDQGQKRFFLGADNATFWELKKSNGKFTAVQTGYMKGAPNVKDKTAGKNTTYAIAYVDNNGVPQSFGMEKTSSGKIASTSCWNSLKGLSAGGGSKFLKF